MCNSFEKNGKSRSERISRPIEALQAIELFAHLTIRFVRNATEPPTHGLQLDIVRDNWRRIWPSAFGM